MYTLLKNKEIKRITKAEIPSFFTALILTETMFHFGSYTLESAAFLSTWFVLSFLMSKLFSISTGSNKKKSTNNGASQPI